MRTMTLTLNLIGAKIKIVESVNADLVGVEGKVVDETKNLVILEDGRKIIKEQVIFEVEKEGETFVIKGEEVQGLSYDRFKKSK